MKLKLMTVLCMVFLVATLVSADIGCEECKDIDNEWERLFNVLFAVRQQFFDPGLNIFTTESVCLAVPDVEDEPEPVFGVQCGDSGGVCSAFSTETEATDNGCSFVDASDKVKDCNSGNFCCSPNIGTLDIQDKTVLPNTITQFLAFKDSRIAEGFDAAVYWNPAIARGNPTVSFFKGADEFQYSVKDKKMSATPVSKINRGFRGLDGQPLEPFFSSDLDAVVRVPGNSDDAKVYLFKGSSYIRIDESSGMQDQRRLNIDGQWNFPPKFKEKLDAAFFLKKSDRGNDLLFFFKGDEFILFNSDENEVVNTGKITDLESKGFILGLPFSEIGAAAYMDDLTTKQAVLVKK